MELLDQGYDVDIYEQRPFIGGKVASYKDRSGNHVEMGLHVFFGCAVCSRNLAAAHVWLQPALLLLHPTLHVMTIPQTPLSMHSRQACCFCQSRLDVLAISIVAKLAPSAMVCASCTGRHAQTNCSPPRTAGATTTCSG